jgi:hypothetical protein
MGITVIAIVAFAGGALQLMSSLALLGIGGLTGGGGFFLWGLVILALGIAELAIAYGFWTVKPWAWRLGVIVALVSVAWAVVSLVLVRFDLGNLLITVVVSAILIYYLNLPSIRTVFGAPASGLPIVGNALDPYLNRIKI